MNILIMTLGSRGDVQPFVALGKGLQDAGHEVTVCAVSRFEDFVTEHGLKYAYMNDEILALIDSDEVREIMGNTTNVVGALNAMVKLAKQAGPLQRMMMEDTWKAAEQANPDLIIFHPKTYGGSLFAEKLGARSMLAPTLPQFIPTADFTAMGFPKLPLGGGYNRMTYSLTTRLTVLGVAQYTNRWRKEQGLKPLPMGANFLRKQAGEWIPVLHPLSKYVIPIPSDWDENVRAMGYWFLDHPADWQPSPALQAFLDAGEPPVYVGFGSMVGLNPREITQQVIQGLQQADVRGIIATGWGGLQADDLPETIFKLDQAPHDWLFSRMAAVVHHGGAGTTAAGLRAGKPTVICPFFGDQPFWGQRVYELGAGSEPIPQKKLTAEKLAAAIREVTTNPSIQQTAADIGEKLRAEEGVANAVQFIEEYMQPYVSEAKAEAVAI